MTKMDLDWKPLLLAPVIALVALPLTGSFSTWLTLTVAGLAMGMIIFIIASGLTLVFGLMDVLNFGHGVFIALGAFVATTVIGGLEGWAGDSAAAQGASVGAACLAAMVVAVTIGTIIGAIAGMSRGWLGTGLMWLTDLFLSLPQLPLLLLVIYLFRDTLKSIFGPEGGVFVLIVAVIGGLRWMPVARLVRAQFLSLREKEFVEAARALGATRLRQVVRHILPNALGPVIIAGTIDVAAAILAESTLSFLGLGFPPDIPTWGRILFDSKDYLDIAPHWAMFPGAAIFLAVVTINFIGDGLRVALDARRVL